MSVEESSFLLARPFHPSSSSSYCEKVQMEGYETGQLGAGLSTGAPLTSADVYWKEVTKKGQIYSPRYDHAVVKLKKEKERFLFLFGGDSGNFYSVLKYFNDLYVYDTELSLWSQISPVSTSPSGRSGHSLICFQKRLHMFGGLSHEGLMNDLWSFDVKKSIWVQRKYLSTEVPPRRAFHTAVISHDHMFIYGGSQADMPGIVWKFSFAAKTWEAVGIHQREVPLSRAMHTAEILHGEWMYIFGGEIYESREVTNELWRFHLVKYVWERLTPNNAQKCPSPRIGHAGVCVGGRWLIQGGRRSRDLARVTQLGDAWVLTNISGSFAKWKKVKSAFVPFCQSARWGHKMTLIRLSEHVEDERSGNGNVVRQCVLLTGGITLSPLPLH